MPSITHADGWVIASAACKFLWSSFAKEALFVLREVPSGLASVHGSGPRGWGGPHSSGMKNSHSQNNGTELGTVFPFYLGSFGAQRLVEHNNNALETQGFFDLKRLRQDLVYGSHISRRRVNSGEVTYAIFCDHVLVSHQNIESSPARNGLVFTGMKARQKPWQILFPSVFHYLCRYHLYKSSRRGPRRLAAL